MSFWNGFKSGMFFGFVNNFVGNIGMCGYFGYGNGNCGSYMQPWSNIPFVTSSYSYPDYFGVNVDTGGYSFYQNQKYYSQRVDFNSSIFPQKTYQSSFMPNVSFYQQNNFNPQSGQIYQSTFISTPSIAESQRDSTVVPDTADFDLNALRGKHWSAMTDSQLRQVYGNYTRDITSPYTGTAEDLNRYLQGKGVLAGKGQAFIDAQNRYGISAAVLVAITMLESGGGTSNYARNKNNVGGVRIVGSTEFRSFESVEACIMEMGRFLKAGYVNNSGRPLTQLYQVNAKYCPTADPTGDPENHGRWASAVDRFASQVESALA